MDQPTQELHLCNAPGSAASPGPRPPRSELGGNERTISPARRRPASAKMSVQAVAGRDVNAGVLVSVVLEALSLCGETTALGGARYNARRAAGDNQSGRSRGLR